MIRPDPRLQVYVAESLPLFPSSPRIVAPVSIQGITTRQIGNLFQQPVRERYRT
jgi:hypothetical protein